jgi:hypothetical protein
MMLNFWMTRYEVPHLRTFGSHSVQFSVYLIRTDY